jgi:hypothetical protein
VFVGVVESHHLCGTHRSAGAEYREQDDDGGDHR